MDSFEGRIAVVTGGGTGMGRELVIQLAAAGCHVATCDVIADHVGETQELALAAAPAGTRVTTHLADVADEAQVLDFAGAVAEAHTTDHVHLLFNNAGIGGGGSFVEDGRAEWERTFDICWGGVYLCTRAFLPLLLRSDEGRVVNTSSVNGFWASIGPHQAHTAYSAAKFAVRGFTEALITDFRLHAPHLSASVVLPGHVGTSIVINSSKLLGRDPKELTEAQLVVLRERLGRRGIDVSSASDEDLRQGVQAMAEAFRDVAPLTAADAARIILDGVRARRWRILVGDDAVAVDRMVRERPEEVYETSFIEQLQRDGVFRFSA